LYHLKLPLVTKVVRALVTDTILPPTPSPLNEER